MVYYLLFTILIDLVRLLNVFTHFLPPQFYTVKYEMMFFLIINALVFVITLGGYLNARSPVIRKLSLDINKKAGGLKSLKIAAASDIHLGTIIARRSLERIVKKINSIKPDIVMLPGDVVDEDIGPVIKRNLGEFLRNIKSKYGTYAITGNHEYIGGAEAACKYLEEHGITELRDSHIKIADSFYIIGREDRASKGFAGKLRKPLADLVEGMDADLPLILMDHQPVRLEEAEKYGIDLQLSGHTHHGQLWPFNFITKKIYEVSMGYKKKGNTHYYVSSGAGSWGPPIRTGNRPEILEIDLNFI
jgi:predicted MPP superfamily phosphohydrolase